LAYDQLRTVNPRMVHATALGFGEDGPYGGQPAYDDLVQGLSGTVALMERQVGEPRYVPMIVVDKTTGLSLAAAVLAALFHRERTGEGQAVTVPMFETMASFVLVEHLADATFEPPTAPAGYARVLSPFRRPYRTADGHICALPYLDKHFAALFEVVDRPDLAADPRFASISSRVANIDDVYEVVEGLLAHRTTADWLDALGAAGIPCAPVNRLEDLLTDPHLEAVGFWEPVEHPTEGTLRQPRLAWGFGANPAAPLRPAPALGAHTDEVLAEAGLAPARIATLRRGGVVGGA
jgi:crotonobetainyl-CoA:carnitine CoA-transferase CaiB-like acyl-CoA transferase